jgi:hypothetical protein
MNFKLNKALFISSIAVAFAAIFYFISSMAFDDHAEINPTEVATESQCVQTHLTNFVKDVGLAAKGDLDRIKVMCGNAP